MGHKPLFFYEREESINARIADRVVRYVEHDVPRTVCRREVRLPEEDVHEHADRAR